jgi:hypothetical protein
MILSTPDLYLDLYPMTMPNLILAPYIATRPGYSSIYLRLLEVMFRGLHLVLDIRSSHVTISVPSRDVMVYDTF